MLGPKLRYTLSKKLFFPLGRLIGKTGVHPNVITAFSIPLALTAAYFIFLHNYILGFIFILLAAFMDNLDGAVAKTQHKSSTWGGYFDAMIDKYVELIVYAGFGFAGFTIEAMLLGFTVMVNSYAKPSLALRIPMDNRDWPAIGERADRLGLLIVGTLAAAFYPIIAGFNTISTLLLFLAAINFIGGIQRMLFAKGLIDEYEAKKNLKP